MKKLTLYLFSLLNLVAAAERPDVILIITDFQSQID